MWLTALETMRQLRTDRMTKRQTRSHGGVPVLVELTRMSVVKASDIFTRHPLNPIITADGPAIPRKLRVQPWCRARRWRDAAAGQGRGPARHLAPARRAQQRRRNGLAIRPETPLIAPEPDTHPEEIWGCEDPRLTWLPELDQWAIAYTAYSRRGPLVSLALTHDFTEVRKMGPVMPPEDKDAALFPRRIDGRWAMIHRPSPLRGFAPHVGFVLARPASLGRPRAAARSPRWGLVGRREDRSRPAAARDRRWLAGLLPRRPLDIGRAHLSRWPGAARPR